MPDFRNMTDEELEPWLSGHNAAVGSVAYNAAHLERDRRLRQARLDEIEKQNLDFIIAARKVVNSIDKLTNAVHKLKETWIQKLFWLGLIAVISGVLIEVVSHLVKNIFNIRS